MNMTNDTIGDFTEVFIQLIFIIIGFTNIFVYSTWLNKHVFAKEYTEPVKSKVTLNEPVNNYLRLTPEDVLYFAYIANNNYTKKNPTLIIVPDDTADADSWIAERSVIIYPRPSVNWDAVKNEILTSRLINRIILEPKDDKGRDIEISEADSGRPEAFAGQHNFILSLQPYKFDKGFIVDSKEQYPIEVADCGDTTAKHPLSNKYSSLYDTNLIEYVVDMPTITGGTTTSSGSKIWTINKYKETS